MDGSSVLKLKLTLLARAANRFLRNTVYCEIIDWIIQVKVKDFKKFTILKSKTRQDWSHDVYFSNSSWQCWTPFFDMDLFWGSAAFLNLLEVIPGSVIANMSSVFSMASSRPRSRPRPMSAAVCFPGARKDILEAALVRRRQLERDKSEYWGQTVNYFDQVERNANKYHQWNSQDAIEKRWYLISTLCFIDITLRWLNISA